MTVTNVTAPTITGTAQVGKTLQTSNGTWTSDVNLPLHYSYEWLRCDAGGGNCVVQTGKTGSSYVCQTGDAGSTIRSRVTAVEYTPAPPTGSRLWDSGSPINTLIPGGVGVVLDYNQGVLNGLSGIGFNGGGWGVGVFSDTSGNSRTVTNPDGWKLDGVKAPAQFSAYVNAMLGKGDTEHHSVMFDGTHVHNIYGANAALTTANSMGEFRADGDGFWDNNMGPWCGRASGFSSVTGAILKSEWDAGLIEHALCCGWPKNRIGSAHVDPASTSDGSAGSGGIPMGSRLQLDPTLSDAQLKALGVTDANLCIAHAMQLYGVYVCDSTSWMTLYAQSWDDNGAISWSGAGVPASLVPKLRVVDPPSAPTFDDRTVFGQPHKP